MGGQRLRERLPFMEEPGNVLLRLLTLERDRPCPLPVDVQRGIGEGPAQVLQARLDRVDLGLECIEPPSELAHRGIDPAPTGGATGLSRRSGGWSGRSLAPDSRGLIDRLRRRTARCRRPRRGLPEVGRGLVAPAATAPDPAMAALTDPRRRTRGAQR